VVFTRRDELSAAMSARGLSRIDFLGSGKGMWAVHPPPRSAAFYEALPELIGRIELETSRASSSETSR